MGGGCSVNSVSSSGRDSAERAARLYRSALGCFDSTPFDATPDLGFPAAPGATSFEVIPLWAGARPGDVWVVGEELRMIVDRCDRSHPASEAFATLTLGRSAADEATAQRWIALHEVWEARAIDRLPEPDGARAPARAR